MAKILNENDQEFVYAYLIFFIVVRIKTLFTFSYRMAFLFIFDKNCFMNYKVMKENFLIKNWESSMELLTSLTN